MTSVPRVCGGDPAQLIPTKILPLVFPVYAGVILLTSGICVANQRVPRVCGGDPQVVPGVSQYRACSPCMRG